MFLITVVVILVGAILVFNRASSIDYSEGELNSGREVVEYPSPVGLVTLEVIEGSGDVNEEI